MYCSAMITRLLVGMLTPEMRAKVLVSQGHRDVARPGLRRVGPETHENGPVPFGNRHRKERCRPRQEPVDNGMRRPRQRPFAWAIYGRAARSFAAIAAATCSLLAIPSTVPSRPFC